MRQQKLCTAVLCSMVALSAAAGNHKAAGEAQVLDAIFNAPINEKFIAKMLPVVKHPERVAAEVPAEGSGIQLQKKWGCIYVPDKTFKRYVRLKGELLRRADTLIRQELKTEGIVDKVKESIEVSKRMKQGRATILEQMLAAMPDHRERLLLLCIERTSHGFGNGLMNTIPYAELLVPLEKSMAMRAARLELENDKQIAKETKGYEVFGITGLSVNLFVDKKSLKPGWKGRFSRVRKYARPGYVIAAVQPGSPAAKSGLLENDVIVGVGGKMFKTADEVEKCLGQAIETAEAEGQVMLNIRRSSKKDADPFATFTNGQPLAVALRLPKVGGFAATMPINCPKSAKYAACLAEYLSKDVQDAFNNQYFHNLALLGLLSVGDPKYDKLVGNYVMQMVPKTDSCPGTSCCTWTHTSGAIALCEYYLRTRDPRVKPGIEKLYNILAAGQFPYYGSGHKCRGGDYRGSGMNITCAHVLLCFALMKKCGINVDNKRVFKSLAFLKGATDHGMIRYAGVETYGKAGDQALDFHYDGSNAGTSARGGATAIAARLLGDDEYANALVRGIRHELGNDEERFKDFTTTHGLPVMGMFWGYLALGGADEAALSQALHKFIWYFQTHRQPGKSCLSMYRHGGDRYLSTIYLLAFNTHKHNLYVTGKSWWTPGYKVPLATGK